MVGRQTVRSVCCPKDSPEDPGDCKYRLAEGEANRVSDKLLDSDSDTEQSEGSSSDGVADEFRLDDRRG